MKEPEHIPGYATYGPGLHFYYITKGMPSAVLAEAFATGTTRIALITEGTLDIGFDKEYYTLHGHDSITIPATTLCTIRGTDNYGLYLLSTSTAFLLNHSLKIIGNESFSFLVAQSPVVIQANLQNYNTLIRLLTLLSVLLTVSSPFQKEKVTLCFNLLLFELASHYNPVSPAVTKRVSQREKIVLGFLNLVAQNCRGQHGVKFYADRLYITPDYLNKVVRDSTGSAVKHFIEEAILAEAKNLLHTTELTIREISEELEFTHPGFFSTFFKKLAGVPPSAYRQAQWDSKDPKQ